MKNTLKRPKTEPFYNGKFHGPKTKFKHKRQDTCEDGHLNKTENVSTYCDFALAGFIIS